MEDLGGCLERVLDHRDDVGIGAVGEDHGVSLEGPPQDSDPVPEPARLLVGLRLRCGQHLAFEPSDEAIGLSGHERAEVVH
ncbi:unannotated protein [freshwater metagenome]|uniref:Unannotated protein n=1 Tax=freshwater metagenome TaxID=449393 RepID=A0A6J7EH11_9ZZZZ